MHKKHVLSVHRLPRPYRLGLAVLWFAPVIIFFGLLVMRWGLSATLLDLRLLLPLLLMALPAWYVWQEGVDVLPDGIVRRMHIQRYYAYDDLDHWDYDSHPERRTLTVWDAQRRKVLEYRTGHLTDWPALRRALDDHVRPGTDPKY